MKIAKACQILLSGALLVACYSSILLSLQPSSEPVSDLGSMIQEGMVLNMEGNQRQLVIWYPFEFFVEIYRNVGGLTTTEAEKELMDQKPYQLFIVQCSWDKDDGSTSYASEKEVSARAVLKSDTGQEIEPVDDIPPSVSDRLAAMKELMAGNAGAAGAAMHLLLFPATIQEEKAIVDMSRREKLTMVLKADEHFKEAEFVWHTPFDALTQVPPCFKCKEPVSAKWFYCPWCGASLEEK
jgi:hypothetical protein